MKPLVIETAQLEIACNRIVEKLKNLKIERVEIKQDFYWELPFRQAYEMKFAIDKPLVGSLVDDWSELVKLADKADRTTFVDFDRLASILKAISEELNPEEG